LKDREGFTDALNTDDKSLLLAICNDYEGETPTAHQKILIRRTAGVGLRLMKVEIH